MIAPRQLQGGLPNLFVVGAAKCGTTYLHRLLNTHPEICMSTVKEPHFFAGTSINPESVQRVGTLEEYRALFPVSPTSKVVGEASPSYLFDPDSAKRIAGFCPEAKIIIMLRDPIARLYSHYLMDIRLGHETLPLREALDKDRKVEPRLWGGPSALYLELSQYSGQIARFLQQFPREQVLILEVGDDQADGRPTRMVLAEFLGVDPGAFMADRPTASERNSHVGPRGDLARRILHSQRLKSTARRLLSREVRARIRRALLTEDYEPQIDAVTMTELVETFRPEVAAVRRLVDAELPTLTAGWH